MATRVYRHLEGAEEIVIGADPGEGVSFAGAVAISKRYKDAPLVFHARIESPQFGCELFNLGLYVKKKTGNFPLLAVERNIGQATITKLLDLGYPPGRLYKQKTFDRVAQREQERYGWVTTSANRRKMLDELAMDLRNKRLKIYDAETVNEMLTFVISERTNEPRPESGCFSDLIMSAAIANQLVGIVGGSSRWLSTAAGDKNKADDRFLPATAQGFIVEPWREERDWRSV